MPRQKKRLDLSVSQRPELRTVDSPAFMKRFLTIQLDFSKRWLGLSHPRHAAFDRIHAAYSANRAPDQ